MAFDTLASYVVISILTSKVPFLYPKHIAICLTTGCIVAIKLSLDVPKLSMSCDDKQVGFTVHAPCIKEPIL